MSFEIEGRLYKKMEVNQVTDSFRKREFVLELEDGAYTQLVKFQLTQSNCEKLDPYSEGDQVKVTFSLRGREYTKDGNTSYFTNLDAWRIENAGSSTGGETGAPSDAIETFPNMSDDPGLDDDTDDLPF